VNYGPALGISGGDAPLSSGHAPGAVTQGGDDIDGATEGCDISPDGIDSRNLTAFDLGDPSLGYAEKLSELSTARAVFLTSLHFEYFGSVIASPSTLPGVRRSACRPVGLLPDTTVATGRICLLQQK
jgi:hypothetical protein